MTLEEVASKAGTDKTQISKLESGSRRLTLDWLRRLSRALGVSLNDLLAPPPGVDGRQPRPHRPRAGGKSARSLAEGTAAFIPVMVRGQVQAGAWRPALEWAPDDWYPVTVPLDPRFPGVKRFGLEVRGPAMDLLYPEGTILICVRLEELERAPVPGQRVIVERRNGNGLIEATVKEYQLDSQGKAWLVPRSSDSRYQAPVALEGSGEIRIVALVIGSYKPE